MIVKDNISGKLRQSDKVIFVERVFALKASGSKWEVIDEILNYWKKQNPKKYRSFVVDINKKRDTRANKYGSNKSHSLRSTLDVPEDIITMIRAIYKSDELAFDKYFFNEMWKRYPALRVSEVL